MQSGVPTKGLEILGEAGMTDKPIVGIDVSKGWLDACVAGARVERIANNAEAVGAGSTGLARRWWVLSRPAATSGP
jgi:hypothetical protein